MNERVGTCQCGGAIIVPSNMVNPTPHCEDCGGYVVILQTEPYQPKLEFEDAQSDEWAV